MSSYHRHVWKGRATHNKQLKDMCLQVLTMNNIMGLLLKLKFCRSIIIEKGGKVQQPPPRQATYHMHSWLILMSLNGNNRFIEIEKEDRVYL